MTGSFGRIVSTELQLEHIVNIRASQAVFVERFHFIMLCISVPNVPRVTSLRKSKPRSAGTPPKNAKA